jgi:hypothetical protein
MHAYSYTPTLHAYSYTPTLTSLLCTPTLTRLLLHAYSYTPALTRLLYTPTLHAYYTRLLYTPTLHAHTTRLGGVLLDLHIHTGENPSWPFFIVTVGTGAGSLALIFITTFVLWAKGYLVS